MEITGIRKEKNMDGFFDFGYLKEQPLEMAPLAYRMRPASLAEFEEQAAIIGQDTLLRRAIEADLLKSMLFFGPPGSGKTALANIIAGMTGAHFEVINAVTAGLAEIRRVIEKAKERQSSAGVKTVLFAVKKERAGEVPLPLRDASYKGAAGLGHGKGYKYPPDYPGHWVAQEYLPPSLKGRLFYQPSQQGKEKLIYEHWLKRISVKQTT